jgi:hypothetical protein
MADDVADADTDMLRQVAGARARLQLALPALERRQAQWRDAVAAVAALRAGASAAGGSKAATAVWMDVGGGTRLECESGRARALAQAAVDDAAAAVEALEAEVRRCRATLAATPAWVAEVMGGDRLSAAGW